MRVREDWQWASDAPKDDGNRLELKEEGEEIEIKQQEGGKKRKGR
jgi:hypothetical protein